MKRIVIVLLSVFLVACSSSPAASGAVSSAAELTLQEKFDLYSASEHDATFSFEITMNDKAVNYTIWKDGVGEIYDSGPELARSMVEARSGPAYERFLDADLDDLNFSYTLVDDRDHDRMLFSYGNGELWYEAEKYESLSANFITAEQSMIQAISDSFGENNYKYQNDNGKVQLDVWMDGTYDAVIEAAVGTPSAVTAWGTVQDSIISFSGYIESVISADYEDPEITINILNENDLSQILLQIVNGEVVYDAAGLSE